MNKMKQISEVAEEIAAV